MEPLITICTPTYGRVNYLQEYLGCLEAQSYKNIEVIIANTNPQQTLHYNNPKVKIINCSVRPSSLGECYNVAINEAQGQYWAILDTDDWFGVDYITARINYLVSKKLNHIPRFFKTLSRTFDIEFIEPQHNNLIFCDNTLNIRYGCVNQSCDIDLINSAINTNIYHRIDLPDDKIEFIYFFNQNEGLQSTFTAYDAMPQKIIDNNEPQGDIYLQPVVCNPNIKINKFLKL